ncbi:hypothetical protein CPB84DRAFT_381379 [Gymnopilus junonius]|uniref:F-box domain-containing protein n=1 Tax=Gymnopilus junonius TaxID=109634 RepID=A0A9P5TG48_GYMJU|nr:hypothetical protein CPB84DRAFT_381379 [Gymnopilus junonius]
MPQPIIRPDSAEFPCFITKLPPELIATILKYPDIELGDILRVRRTCKYLAEVTRTKELWWRILHRYTDNPSRFLHLERPLELYTAEELENHFLRRKGAEIGWRSGDENPTRVRNFQSGQALAMHLLQGGRWLLVTTRTGSVTYYDLEEDTIIGLPLIPDQLTNQRRNHAEMAAEIDTKSPIPSFNLALALVKSAPNRVSSDTWVRMIQIWRIDLVLGNQRGDKLSATHLVSFPLPDFVSEIRSLSILGCQVSYCANCVYRSFVEYAAFVADWTRAKEAPLAYPMHIIPLYDTTENLDLLPKNRIIAVLVGDVRLYDFSNVPELKLNELPMSHLSELVDAIHPLWRSERSVSRRICYMSQLYDHQYFVLQTSRRVYLAVINEDNHAHPPIQMVEVFNLPTSIRYKGKLRIGAASSFFINHPTRATLISYFWSSKPQRLYARQGSFVEISHKSLPPRNRSFPDLGPFVDEHSGHVILSDGAEGAQLIDFSLLYVHK